MPLTHSSLFGQSESDAVGAKVVNGVPLSEKCITEDGQWASWLGDIYAEISSRSRCQTRTNEPMPKNVEMHEPWTSSM